MGFSSVEDDMRRALVLIASVVLALAGCAPSPEGFRKGSVEDCGGVAVVVNYGILSDESVTTCVEFETPEALGRDLVAFAGFELEGTETYGDQVICRVNGLPSEQEPFTVAGEEPHSETCADMPPAFGYWALWVKESESAEWAYAEEGIGTLPLTPGMTVGIVFSSGGETPVPSDP